MVNNIRNKRGMIGVVIISYFIVSMGLVFANKVIMNDNIFPYPIFITFIQFVIAFFCFFFTSYYSNSFVFFYILYQLYIYIFQIYLNEKKDAIINIIIININLLIIIITLYRLNFATQFSRI